MPANQDIAHYRLNTLGRGAWMMGLKTSSPARISFLPPWLWLVLPVLVAVWLRLSGLTAAGAFIDEGAHILSALDPRVAHSFEPLAQGRPWLVYLFRPAGWFGGDALTGARMMTVGAGLVTMLALGWTLQLLSGRRAALLGLWLWAVLPFAVFHERLALQDPFVTALLAVSVACLVTGLRRRTEQTWPWFVATGLAFGSAFMLKVSAAVALPWIAAVYVTVQLDLGRSIFDRRLGLIALGAILPALTLGASLAQLGNGLDRYSAFPTLATTGYFSSALTRGQTWLGWYAGYDGWPLALLIALALVLAGRNRNRLALGCLAAALVALLVTTLAYHNLYARYILADHLPLVLGAALALGSNAGAGARYARWFILPVTLVVVATWGFASWTMRTNSTRARVPAGEIAQYYTGPWSGQGVAELTRYLTDYADQHGVRCVVVTHRFLRPGCYGLMLAERGDARLSVLSFIVYEPEELSGVFPFLRRAGGNLPAAYFLLYEGSLFPPRPWLDRPDSPARRLHEVERGGGEKFTLYQLTLP